jgi:hypothetical protein
MAVHRYAVGQVKKRGFLPLLFVKAAIFLVLRHRMASAESIVILWIKRLYFIPVTSGQRSWQLIRYKEYRKHLRTKKSIYYLQANLPTKTNPRSWWTKSGWMLFSIWKELFFMVICLHSCLMNTLILNGIHLCWFSPRLQFISVTIWHLVMPSTGIWRTCE